jgi:hypothetical protein
MRRQQFGVGGRGQRKRGKDARWLWASRLGRWQMPTPCQFCSCQACPPLPSLHIGDNAVVPVPNMYCVTPTRMSLFRMAQYWEVVSLLLMPYLFELDLFYTTIRIILFEGVDPPSSLVQLVYVTIKNNSMIHFQYEKGFQGWFCTNQKSSCI